MDRNVTFGAIAVIVLLILTSVAGVANQSASPAGPVEQADSAEQPRPRLSLTVDRATCLLGQSFVVNVSLANDGPGDLYLFRPFYWSWGGLELFVKDWNGREWSAGIECCVPPVPPDPAKLLLLGANQFFGLQTTLPVSSLMGAAGKYSIRVTYQSHAWKSVYSAETQRLPALWHESDQLTSNVVAIDVRIKD